MKRIVLVSLAAILAFPAWADKRNVGNFSVETNKDPIDDSENVIAMTIQGTSVLTIRCLADGQSVLVGFLADASNGDDVDVQFRVDQAPAQHLSESILNTMGRLATFEIADASLVGQLSGAKTVAMRVGVDNATTTMTFQLRDSAKVVAEVQKACTNRKNGG